ncbi:PDGLE domain-containing protein [Actinokineospora sp. PR83]|uniref:PDGLE domain-containing protein n=1 Tax=Actinokineospora sp. PR83 TaxID=2884908 RepID=UPI0027E1E418|nr:PDGLE domain-containing protein [Actinokineospora sp. PR83]MCG8914238.1 PDGLE domain-containing protein [Actinokineospora sp. PR83]
MTTKSRRNTGFLLGFLLIALVLAGGVSYFADSDPDGLDHATLQGCEVRETPEGEELLGDCIAQNAQDHKLAGSPFADYAVNGDEGLSGLAGVFGVVVTLVLAGGLFWVLRKRSAEQ